MKHAAILTTLLTNGGLARQIESLCRLFKEHEYWVDIYSLTPRIKGFRGDFGKWSHIIYPTDRTALYMSLGAIRNAWRIVDVLKNPGNTRSELMKIKEIHVSRYVLDRNFSNILGELWARAEASRYEHIIGLDYHTIPYLRILVRYRWCDVSYIEISSPAWREKHGPISMEDSEALAALDRVIVPSETIGRELVSAYGPVQYMVVPLYLSMPAYHPPQFIKSIGVAARLAPEKNQDLLIRVMEVLKNKYRRDDIKLVIVGSGSEEARLRSLTSSLGLDDNVAFLGFVRGVENYIDRIGVMVLLSDIESLNAALLEALYFGKPIISTDTGAASELISGENGFLIQDKTDLDGLARMIISALSEENYQKMSHASRYIYLSKYGDTEKKLASMFMEV